MPAVLPRELQSTEMSDTFSMRFKKENRTGSAARTTASMIYTDSVEPGREAAAHRVFANGPRFNELQQVVATTSL